MRRIVITAASVIVVAGAVSSCLTPTEIVLSITTNACASLNHVDIYVTAVGEHAGVAPAAVANGLCAGGTDGDIGTLVVVPAHSAAESVRIVVAGALTAATCGDVVSDAKCILARRSLGYVSHASLPLPVFLDIGCAGARCDDPKTCEVIDGIPRCVDEQPQCTQGTSCDLDASTAIDTLPLACPSPGAAIFGKTPIDQWSFDAQTTTEDQNHFQVATQTATSSFALTGGVPGCSSFLRTTAAQPLTSSTTIDARSHFGVAFYAHATALSSVLTAGPLTLLLTGTTTGLTIGGTTYNVSTIFDGAWHSYAIDYNGGPNTPTFTLWIDGKSVLMDSITSTPGAGGLLAAGGDNKNSPTVDVDQVERYTLP